MYKRKTIISREKTVSVRKIYVFRRWDNMFKRAINFTMFEDL